VFSDALSNLGNGLLGLLALTVSPEVHDTLAGVPFVVPINLGPAATFPDSPTVAQIANIRQDHDELKALFVKYYATDKALKQQIITAADKLYLRTLNHCITGFANVTTRQMLVHLYTPHLQPPHSRQRPKQRCGHETTVQPQQTDRNPLPSNRRIHQRCQCR
jgi:hypothetical protein